MGWYGGVKMEWDQWPGEDEVMGEDQVGPKARMKVRIRG